MVHYLPPLPRSWPATLRRRLASSLPFVTGSGSLNPNSQAVGSQLPFLTSGWHGSIATKTKVTPSKYIMKTDNDAFVRIDEVFSSLKGKPSDGLYYGLIASKSSPQRDKDSKWYISEKEWPHDKYPLWAHGVGYVISRDIAKFIVHGHQQRKLQVEVADLRKELTTCKMVCNSCKIL